MPVSPLDFPNILPSQIHGVKYLYLCLGFLSFWSLLDLTLLWGNSPSEHFSDARNQIRQEDLHTIPPIADSSILQDFSVYGALAEESI